MRAGSRRRRSSSAATSTNGPSPHTLAQGAPIDGFGVGTSVATSKDAPSLGGVYKLVEIERAGAAKPVMKLSAGGKASFPGRKQIWRTWRGGQAVADVIALEGEAAPYDDATPLLEQVMKEGRRLAPSPTLAAARDHHTAAVARLPRDVRMLEPRQTYPVSRTSALERLTARTVAAIADDLVPPR